MSTYTQVTGQQPDLRKMVKGQPVTELQLLLDKHCYGPVPDGYFGDETERCLNEFKAAYGMVADGLVDRATWSVLNGTPRMIARVAAWPEIRGNVLHWIAVNAGCPPIPARTVISQCWAFERANPASVSLVYDFGPTSDQPIGTQEPFSIDLLTLFPNDGQYTASITVGPDAYTVEYEVVHRQVV